MTDIEHTVPLPPTPLSVNAPPLPRRPFMKTLQALLFLGHGLVFSGLWSLSALALVNGRAVQHASLEEYQAFVAYLFLSAGLAAGNFITGFALWQQRPAPKVITGLTIAGNLLCWGLLLLLGWLVLSLSSMD